MSYQIISKMRYNAETRQIETWQHSNNVWPRTDYFYALDATDDNIFDIIMWHAGGDWQGRKWQKQFTQMFAGFPELDTLHNVWDYAGSYDDLRYREHLANVEARRNKSAIVARFRQLASIY